MGKVLIRSRRDQPGSRIVELPARFSPNGKRQLRTFSGDDALEKALAWAELLEEGIRLREAGVFSEITVSEACREWLSGPYGKALRPSTRRTNESAIAKHVEPAFGSVRIGALDEPKVLAFINEKLEAGLSPDHIRTILSIVRRGVAVCCRQHSLPCPSFGDFSRLLAAAASARELEVREMEWWTEEEIAKILQLSEDCDAWFEAFVRVAADTGMRRGEILGLQVADLNFVHGEIRVRRSIVGHRQGSTKTGKARSVVMAPGLVEALLYYLKPGRFKAAEGGVWVFESPHGGHASERDFRPHWERLRKRFAARGVRPLKFHCFRHSWITHAIAHGEPIPWVSSQVGHASPAFTLRQYAHAQPRRGSDLGWLDRTAVNE